MMAPVLVLKQTEEVRKRAEDLIRKVRLQGKKTIPGEFPEDDSSVLRSQGPWR